MICSCATTGLMTGLYFKGKNMAYLCVNKNGEELICQNLPKRYGYIKKYINSWYGKIDNNGNRYEEILQQDENLDHWRDQEYLNMGEYCINYEILLPHGTIEKIIGKKMNWENDPVEI